MKAFALHEGSFSVDSSKKFLPFDQAVDDPKSRPGSLFIYVQPFLIERPEGLIVMDTGLGFENAEGKMAIHENIRKLGYDPLDVAYVLMSHLHFDHSGGMVWNKNGRYELSFPNAEYIIQRGEWETAYSKPSRSYRTEIFDVVQRSGNIQFVEGSGKFNDFISYELTGGHTEYHQVFLINSENEVCFFGGDILPEPEQLLRRFSAKYDFDGRRSMELREEYGKRAAQGNWLSFFYHSKGLAIGKISQQNDVFKILNV